MVNTNHPYVLMLFSLASKAELTALHHNASLCHLSGLHLSHLTFVLLSMAENAIAPILLFLLVPLLKPSHV